MKQYGFAILALVFLCPFHNHSNVTGSNNETDYFAGLYRLNQGTSIDEGVSASNFKAPTYSESAIIANSAASTGPDLLDIGKVSAIHRTIGGDSNINCTINNEYVTRAGTDPGDQLFLGYGPNASSPGIKRILPHCAMINKEGNGPSSLEDKLHETLNQRGFPDEAFLDDLGLSEYPFAPMITTVLYVDSSATGTNDGSSWANAFTDLQTALNSVFLDSGDTIFVAKGTYYPTAGTDRDSSFIIPDSVKLYGGFCPSMGIDSYSERNWKQYVTILSGDIGNKNDSLDNSYSVVQTLNVSPITELNGFTIMNGNGLNSAGGGENGGGWDNVANIQGAVSSPTIRNTRFVNNASEFGGGLANRAQLGGVANPLIENCAFSCNYAESIGGGLLNFATLDQSQANPTILNTIFLGNYSEAFGGGIYSASTQTGTTNPHFLNVTIAGNRALLSGGAFENQEGNSSQSDPVFVNTIMFGNSSGFANTIGSGNPTFEYSLIQGRAASGTNLDGSTDPLFIDQPDFNNAPTCKGNLSLEACSPAINVGINDSLSMADTIDLACSPRFFAGGTVDLGAYEYQGFTSTGPIAFVDSSATGGKNTGKSWEDAFTDLQHALEAARNCEDIEQVWVAKGTYQPSQNNNRDTSFCIPDSLQIYGGFCPDMGIDSFDERDWRIFETILSGDIGVPGDSLDNSYRIVNTYNVSPFTKVDGFTISNGAAIGFDIDNLSGAGWGNEASGNGMVSSPQLCNIRFICNSASFAGGAFLNESRNGAKANPEFRQVEFRGNTASFYGAGLQNISVSDNSCSNPYLFNCLFSGNFTTGDGAAITSGGITNGLSAPRIVNTTITGNRSFGPTAILFSYGDLGGTSEPVFINTLAYGNSSGISAPVNNIFFSQIQGVPGTETNLDPNQDPLFVDSIDYNDAPTKAGDFRLRNCSPVLDSGTVDSLDLITDTEDFFGNDRIAFLSVDIGYYEIPDPVPTDSIFNIDCDPYCATGDPNGGAVYIEQVGIFNAGLYNATGPDPGGYGDYTDLMADPGDDDRLFFYLGGQTNPAGLPIFWKVWIDYDLNGSFDNYENVVTNLTNVPFIATVLLPPDLMSHVPYRIRVSASVIGYPEPCSEFINSETEDYTLKITGPPPCDQVLQLQDEEAFGTYQTSQKIETSGDVEVLWNTEFQSREIELGPGFEVPLGKTFITKDLPCGN